jgi:hypothetical protein
LNNADCFDCRINNERFNALFAQAAVEEFLHRREFASVPLKLEP